VHTPVWHASVWVQALASLHVPSGASGFEHAPVPLLQTPATWHGSLAVQTTGFAPAQIPVWHESVCVQAFPSLHAVPLAAFGFEHAPVPGLQESVVQALLSLQFTGFAPTHTPAWQPSLCVQASPSVHADPSALIGLEQTPVSASRTRQRGTDRWRCR
jgi:hypothetical protein